MSLFQGKRPKKEKQALSKPKKKEVEGSRRRKYRTSGVWGVLNDDQDFGTWKEVYFPQPGQVPSPRAQAGYTSILYTAAGSAPNSASTSTFLCFLRFKEKR